MRGALGPAALFDYSSIIPSIKVEDSVSPPPGI
jgi:hypothetical protein